MHPIMYLLAIPICILISAFFSGSETALLRLRREELEKDLKSDTKGPSVVAARDLLKSTSRLLVTILLGNNIINTLAAAFATAFAIQYLGEKTGIIISTAAITILLFLFGEVLPKAIAAKKPRQLSYLTALPLYIFHKMLYPVHLLFDKVIEPFINKITGDKDSLPLNERILYLAKQSEMLKPDGTAIPIITSAAKAAETVVMDIMIPVTQFVTFPITLSLSQMLEKAIESKYTRVPIFSESTDNIVGIVHLKDLIQAVQAKESDIKEIIKPVLRVPERKLILDLLKDMQSTFIHMAIVKDEFGKTQGLVTQEDILEEIVGEIRDEFDKDELLTIQKRSNDSYDAFGMVKVVDFNRETGWRLEAERGDTLSGLTYNKLGRSPLIGDTVETVSYKITVTQVSRSRIIRVQIQKKIKLSHTNH